MPLSTIDAASEPASGLVRPKHGISRPPASFGNQYCCCSLVPNFINNSRAERVGDHHGDRGGDGTARELTNDLGMSKGRKSKTAILLRNDHSEDDDLLLDGLRWFSSDPNFQASGWDANVCKALICEIEGHQRLDQSFSRFQYAPRVRVSLAHCYLYADRIRIVGGLVDASVSTGIPTSFTNILTNSSAKAFPSLSPRMQTTDIF